MTFVPKENTLQTKGRFLRVRVEVETHERLFALCTKANTTYSDMVRQMIEHCLKEAEDHLK